MSVEIRTDPIAPMMPRRMIPSSVVDTRTSASVSPRSPRRRIITLEAVPWRPTLPGGRPPGGSIGPKSPVLAVAATARTMCERAPCRNTGHLPTPVLCAAVATLGTDPFAETDDQQALRTLARDVAA